MGRGRGGFVTIVHSHITLGVPKIVRQYITSLQGDQFMMGEGGTNLIQKIKSQFCTYVFRSIPFSSAYKSDDNFKVLGLAHINFHFLTIFSNFPNFSGLATRACHRLTK